LNKPKIRITTPEIVQKFHPNSITPHVIKMIIQIAKLRLSKKLAASGKCLKNAATANIKTKKDI